MSSRDQWSIACPRFSQGEVDALAEFAQRRSYADGEGSMTTPMAPRDLAGL